MPSAEAGRGGVYEGARVVCVCVRASVETLELARYVPQYWWGGAAEECMTCHTADTKPRTTSGEVRR